MGYLMTTTPFKGKALTTVLNGTKPIAIFKLKVNPILYQKALKEPKLFVIKLEKDVIACSLLSESLVSFRHVVDNREYFLRSTYQFVIGVLLGYKTTDIQEFIKTDTAKICTCICCDPTHQQEI